MPEESSVPDSTTFTPTRPAQTGPVTGPLELAVAVASADGTVVCDGDPGVPGRLDSVMATVDTDVAIVTP